MVTIADNVTQTSPLAGAFASSEDFREASEKFSYLWIGAFSPLWAPFFAATSFGLGGWALLNALSAGRQNSAFGALPRSFTDALSAQYGWLKSSEAPAQILEETAGAVTEAAATGARQIVETQDAVVDAVLTDDLLDSPAIAALQNKPQDVQPVVSAPETEDASVKTPPRPRAVPKK